MRLGRLPGLPILAAAAGLLLIVSPALAQNRPLNGVALVIGQSEYTGLKPLQNPENDARALDDLLDQLGFDVTRVLDADADKLREELADFAKDAKDADVALIYYSGHGIEAGGENFLIPVDADVSTPEKAGEKLIPLSGLLTELQATVPVTIFLLDACRTNSFPVGQLVVLPGEAQPIAVSSEGLGEKGVPLARPANNPESLGTVIGFAASPGRAALDGDPGGHSPYAAALIKHIAAGGYSFGDIMTMVSQEVYLETNRVQLPWTNFGLPVVLYFGREAEEATGDEALIRGGRRDLLLTIASAPPQTRSFVEAVAESEQVPLDALYGMLQALGVDTSAGDAELEKQLREGAQRVRDFMANKPGSAKTDPELIRLSELADRAQEEGAMEVALQFRERASARADELSAARDRDEEAIREDRLEIAETYAEHGQTASLVFDFKTAEARFEQAFLEVEKWDDEKAFEYKAILALTRYWRGEKEGSLEMMERSVEDYEVALTHVTRDSRPAEWAFVQRGMAMVKMTIGEWRNDPALLQEAVDTYRVAFEAMPETEVFQRAITANNLGLGLWALGFRRAGTKDLEEALVYYYMVEDILPEGETLPMLKNNIGLALGTLGARERNAPKLEEAAAILEDAIENDLEQPLDIGRGYSNLGLILMELSSTTGEPAAAERAVAALKEGLAYQKRETAPQDWATIHLNLGLSLTMLGNYTGDKATIEEAVAAFDNALLEFDPQRQSVRWAITVRDRAVALNTLGVLESNAARFEEAIAGFRLVKDELTFESEPYEWGRLQAGLLYALTMLADIKKDVGMLYEALEVARLADSKTPRADSPIEWATNQQNLGGIKGRIYLAEGGIEWLKESADYWRDSLEVVTVELNPAWWLNSTFELGGTLARLGHDLGDASYLPEAEALLTAALEMANQLGNQPVIEQSTALLRYVADTRSAIGAPQEQSEPAVVRARAGKLVINR